MLGFVRTSKWGEEGQLANWRPDFWRFLRTSSVPLLLPHLLESLEVVNCDVSLGQTILQRLTLLKEFGEGKDTYGDNAYIYNTFILLVALLPLHLCHSHVNITFPPREKGGSRHVTAVLLFGITCTRKTRRLISFSCGNSGKPHGSLNTVGQSGILPRLANHAFFLFLFLFKIFHRAQTNFFFFFFFFSRFSFSSWFPESRWGPYKPRDRDWKRAWTPPPSQYFSYNARGPLFLAPSPVSLYNFFFSRL